MERFVEFTYANYEDCVGGAKGKSPSNWGVYLGNSGAITRIFVKSVLQLYRISVFNFASMVAWSFKKSNVWQEFTCSLEGVDCLHTLGCLSLSCVGKDEFVAGTEE